MEFKKVINEVSALLTKSKKTLAGEALNYYTGIMYMSPGKIGGVQVCSAMGQCGDYCLTSSGQLAMSHGQKASLERKYKWAFDKPNFYTQILKEIIAIKKQAEKKGMIPCIRLNGTSDIEWMQEEIVYIKTTGKGQNKVQELVKSEKNIFDLFPDLQFYDYTKRADMYEKFLNGSYPKNYYMTFSRDTHNEDACLSFLERGGSVAMIFDPFVPDRYWGYPCINGDEHDLRFLDPKEVKGANIVGLTPKGVAKWRFIPCAPKENETLPKTFTIYLQREPEENINKPPEYTRDPKELGSKLELAARLLKRKQDVFISQMMDMPEEERNKLLDELLQKDLITNAEFWTTQRNLKKKELTSKRMSPYELSKQKNIKPLGKILYPKHGIKKGQEQVINWTNPKTGEKETLEYDTKGKLIKRNGLPVKENIFYKLFNDLIIY